LYSAAFDGESKNRALITKKHMNLEICIFEFLHFKRQF
jgi:hypothetical protein